MSSCARLSAAAAPAWGFAELEQLRIGAGLTVSRFCRIVGLARRTYYDRRAAQVRGSVRGPWPTPARDGIRANPAQRLARLIRELGPDIVTLEQPDATPLPGTVGVFIGGVTRAVVVTRRDGTRQFVRWDGDVYSTNVPAFTGSDSDVIRLP